MIAQPNAFYHRTLAAVGSTRWFGCELNRLELAGWVVSDAAQFLKLSAHEQQFGEVKLALATGVRQLRERRGLTQAALAKRLGSSQSRVAKMESADTSVSLDLMRRSLLSIGATAGEIAKLIKNAEAV